VKNFISNSVEKLKKLQEKKKKKKLAANKKKEQRKARKVIKKLWAKMTPKEKKKYIRNGKTGIKKFFLEKKNE